ncbi:hypothetical protein [Streptomyces sp. NPDC002994]|uniref:hypothetical protein n=1 Tax=Streptomyces sp. NPDC002994 TaxID=3154441 RepID=UPI0033A991D5
MWRSRRPQAAFLVLPKAEAVRPDIDASSAGGVDLEEQQGAGGVMRDVKVLSAVI